ncbi:MAG: hypothetical protein HMLKMBBP_03138 [Planctomycetes bacterium]|nr:hypothetical protein [Planctomycetota bacterium]
MTGDSTPGRGRVDAARLDAFLSALGTEWRRPARVVIGGGASMIRRGLRDATLDVDIEYEVAPDDDTPFLAALAKLKESVPVNLELASPGDFIPLPEGSADRNEWIARFGAVDVYLCDPVALAVSKLARGHDRDLDDVRALVTAGALTVAALTAAVDDVAARLVPLRHRADAARLREMLARALPPRS